MRCGTGISNAHLTVLAQDKTWNGLKMDLSTRNVGGKNMLRVIRDMPDSDVRLMWNIAAFSSALKVSAVRYVTVAYIDFTRNANSGAPKMGISSALDDDESSRYKTGNFSNWYYLNPNTVGQWGVEYAVIDLHDGGSGLGMPLNKTVNNLYLDFPMGPNDNQEFCIAAVGCFPNKGDAEQFGVWASSVGSMSNTDSSTYVNSSGSVVTIPKDSFDNDNKGFSLLVATSSTFGGVPSISDYLAGSDKGVPRVSAGQQPLFIAGEVDLWNSKDNTYAHSGMAWANGATEVDITTAIGYKLFETIGDVQNNGYATVGLLESSLDENGLPVYKESTLKYMAIFLRNRLLNSLEYDYDGWMYYSWIRGARNGEIFGYTDGGQTDMDPSTPGVQGVPMDFATAICKHFQITTHARYLDGKTTRTTGTGGSYEKTMAKREYLEGSWLECKQYISTWYDLAYYMMHNLWVPNSYNQLQSDYNYMNLYLDSNNGHYVFDSSLTKENSGSYTSGVTYDTASKTIGLAGAKYKTYFGSFESYNPFTPVNVGSAAGESNNPYYLDDGVNKNSAFGGQLTYDNHNYCYSFVCNGEFSYKYSDNLMFRFEGDDDVYLFINGELVLDLGATHNNTCATINLNDYVTWARTVLRNRKDYTLAEVERAEKLNLLDNETYSFDFFYMERHGTGANLRIETNINVVVPDLQVEKKAYQDGIEIPDNGVVDNTRPIEYSFSLTNDSDTCKLYNISFDDSAYNPEYIGVKLTPDAGLSGPLDANGNLKWVRDKDGGTLEASDLVAYVDGYDGDPRRPSTKKLDTIKVTFKDNEALKAFLKNLKAEGTQSGSGNGLYEGDGLWAFATVTIRGIYYTQTATEQGNRYFRNTVKCTSTNGNYVLSGVDSHTAYRFGEPSYFQWAGHKIILDSEKLYSDLKNSLTYGSSDFPALGHMNVTLCDATGNNAEYEHVKAVPGGDVYLEICYDEPGLHTFYLKISDKSGTKSSFLIAVSVYVLDVSDSAVVLDYGLVADLSGDNGLFYGDTVSLHSKETLNTVIGITGFGGVAGYVEQDVSNLEDVGNTRNFATMVSGHSYTRYAGKLETPIYLQHDKPWVLEWQTKGSHSGGMMLSNTYLGGDEGNIYLYNKNDGSSANSDLLSFGEVTANKYHNHGVTLKEHTVKNANNEDVPLNLDKAQTYRLVNEPYTDGTNRVRLFIDGKAVAYMMDYWDGGNDSGTNDASFYFSGRDITFNYIGTYAHPINLTNFNYLKVWEDGLTLNNYRVEYNATKGVMEAVTTDEPGNMSNKMDFWVHVDDNTTDTDGYYGRFNTPVQLHHDRQWAIEFKLSGLTVADGPNNPDKKNEEVMLLTSTGTTEHEYLYLRADTGLVAFGTSDAMGYHNYGIAVKDVISGFDTNDEHIYRLENRINTDGSCMVYLIVDGQELGSMDNYFKAGTAVGYGEKGDIYTGNNFKFTHIGHISGHWPVDCTVHYLQVWEDTAMTTSYHMVNDGSTMKDASVSDPNGNRIDFTSDADGEIAYNDGVLKLENGKLTFTATDLMDEEYQAMIAVSVHDRGFAPSALADKKVDIANEVQMYKNITIIPANVIYYEDDFPALKYNNISGNTITTIGKGSGSLTQGADQDNPYGSDDAYDHTPNNTTGDSLHQIKIDKAGPLASFKFTGTGFEIVGRTNAADSGILIVEVYNSEDVILQADGTVAYDAATGLVKVRTGAQAVKLVPVITKYDNQNNGGAEEIYAVPTVTVDALAHGNYIAVITGVPTNDYDENGNITATQTTYFYLDGIRIFNPMGATNDHYNDVENGAQFSEIRDEILAGNMAAAECGDGIKIGAGMTTWTENNTTDAFGREYTGQSVDSPENYLTLGPNNEVYMDGTFTKSGLVMLVKENNSDAHTLQVAMRAIDYGVFVGAGHTYEAAKVMYGYLDNGTLKWKELTTICSAGEQYYSIPYTDCAKIGEYYMVILQVTPIAEDVPAMISFGALKYKGVEFAAINDVLTNGVGTISGDDIINKVNEQMTSVLVYTGNESAPGSQFAPGDKDTQGKPALLPKYPTLAFEDEIRYNIYFNAENLVSYNTADMGLITFATKNTDGTINDALDVIPGAVYNGSEFMVHTNGIPAKMMGDTLYFKVYAKLADGSYVYSDLYGYSALAYAEDILNGSYSNDLKALIVSMLNYGAEAQCFFGYRTDALMNSALTAEQTYLAAQYSPEMIPDLSAVDAVKAQNFVMNSGSYTAFRPAVVFDGAFAINFYFDPAYEPEGSMTFYYWSQADYEGCDVLSVDNATGSKTLSDVDGLYCGTISGISAKEIGSAYYVVGAYESNGQVYYTNVVTYSLGAYCEYLANDASSDAQALAAATAVYGFYAENYFAQ